MNKFPNSYLEMQVFTQSELLAQLVDCQQSLPKFQVFDSKLKYCTGDQEKLCSMSRSYTVQVYCLYCRKT